MRPLTRLSAPAGASPSRLNTGVSTTTTLASSANPQVAKSTVGLTATVKAGSSPVRSGGTVTFLENGTAPQGTVNGDNAVNLNTSNGQAGFTTGQLSTSALIGAATGQNVYLTLYEGDYQMSADYSGDPADNPSTGTLWQRFDDITNISAGAGSSINACNTGPVILNQGNKGQYRPNPSNIFVSNLPGTVNTVTLGLDGFFTYGASIYQSEALIKGPTGAALDFFSNTGNSSTVLGGSTSPWGNLTFADSASTVVPGSGNYAAGTYKPTAYIGTPSTDTFTSSSSGFYNIPSSFTYAQPHGSGTFANTFANTNPNGTWSLFFNTTDFGSGEGAQSGWCLNFTENPVTVTAEANHVSSFVPNQANAQITASISLASDTGPTGDPTGTSPLTLKDTLNSNFAYSTFSGTGWTCGASGQNVTCTNDSPIAEGNSYPDIDHRRERGFGPNFEQHHEPDVGKRGRHHCRLVEHRHHRHRYTSGVHKRRQHHIHSGHSRQLHGDSHRKPSSHVFNHHRSSTHRRHVDQRWSSERHPGCRYAGCFQRYNHRYKWLCERHAGFLADGGRGSGHHQRQQHKLRGWNVRFLYRGCLGLPRSDLHRDRGSAHRRHAKQYRGTFRYPVYGHGRRLSHHHYSEQRHRFECHAELHPEGGLRAFDYQRSQHDVYDRRVRSFAVTGTGYPAPTFSETGTLPSGVTSALLEFSPVPRLRARAAHIPSLLRPATASAPTPHKTSH